MKTVKLSDDVFNSLVPLVSLPGLTRLYTLRGHTGRVRGVVCSPDGERVASCSDDRTVRVWDVMTGQELHRLEGHTNTVWRVWWSPDSKRIASCSEDKTVRVWDVSSGEELHRLEGHTNTVSQLRWSRDGKQLASCSHDRTIRVWDVSSGEELHKLEGHVGGVYDIEWSRDGSQLASCSHDKTVRIWDVDTGKEAHRLMGHADAVWKVGWSPDGRQLSSCSWDKTVRVWDTTTGQAQHRLKGHTGQVWKVKWSPNGKWLASGSDDGTVRVWDATAGKELQRLEGHTYVVYEVGWSPDGKWLTACSRNRQMGEAEIHIWRTDTWELYSEVKGLHSSGRLFTWHPSSSLLVTAGQEEEDLVIWQLDLEHLSDEAPVSEATHYRNAKVVLVGDSGVGKSGLALVLTHQAFAATESTHGRHVWLFDQKEELLGDERHETRETWLWDLAGQLGYRLIHQLHLNEVAVALVVFNAQSENDPFAGVWHWDRALRLAQSVQGSSAPPLKKFLVAARTDRGGIGANSERIREVVQELGFDGSFATSAKEGNQIEDLLTAIRQGIDWQALPEVNSTVLFRQIKQFLLNEKRRARRLISSVEDLYGTFIHTKDAPKETVELRAQFETCIGLVESVGLIKRLSFGKLVLIQPELLDGYASALVNFVKDEPYGLGSIAEEQVRTGDFGIPKGERAQDAELEKVLLMAMIENLLRRELALREEGMLVFPSLSTKEYPDLSDPKGKAVVFRFEGPISNIYATLAVRLARSGLFKKEGLWRNAVTYATSLGGICGMYLRNTREGCGDLTLFFDESSSVEARRVFTEYVHLYLLQHALPDGFSVRHLLVCGGCHEVISENTIRRRKERNFDWLSCPVCEERISLVEQVPQTPVAPSPRTNEMDEIADIQRDREAAQAILQGKIATNDFDVFLCHHGVDKPIIKQIGEQLKGQGILPWLDEWELRPGLPWQKLLEEQIKHIKSAAVFVGKNGIGPWQEQELGAFLRAFVKRDCPVIPVLLEDAPEKPELPIFLQGMTWVDFRVQDPDPLQQLFWGITGKRHYQD